MPYCVITLDERKFSFFTAAELSAELHHGSPEPQYNSSSGSESPGDHTASTSSESGSDIGDEDYFEVKQHQLAVLCICVLGCMVM